MKIFSYDGAFARTMGRVFDLVLLHILWVVCSLPVITIGASTTALYSITLKMVRNEEPYILRGYIKAFRENFRQAAKLWMIMAGVFLWILFLLRICMKRTLAIPGILGIANGALLIMAGLAALYVFPIQAAFENSVGNILKNSVICSLRYLPYSAAMAATIIIPVLITGFVQAVYPVMLTFWMFAGSSLIAFVNSYFLNMVFQKVS